MLNVDLNKTYTQLPFDKTQFVIHSVSRPKMRDSNLIG